MSRKFSHIGIAVRNIEKALAVFDYALGLKPISKGVLELPKVGVRSVMLPIGEIHIELLEPIVPASDPRGTLARFLEKRGEGLYHIAIEVDDIEAELRILTSKGVTLIDKQVRKDLAKETGFLTAFLHPKSMGGVLIELVQKV